MIGAIIAGFGFLITSQAVWSCFRIMPCLKAEMRVLNAIFNKSLLSNLEDDWYQGYVVFDEGKVEWPEESYIVELIPELILAWNEDPERTFAEMFGHPPATRKLWEIREATIDRRVPRHAGCIPQADSEDLF